MAAVKSLQQTALDLLSRREHSRVELQRKLSKHQVAAADLSTLLTKLEHENLLSDARFTEAYVTMRSQQGYGPERISQELRARGVAEDLIKKKINMVVASSWTEFAIRVRQKKFSHATAPDYPTRAKQMQFLRYRGFNNQQISQAMQAATNERS